MVKGWTEVAQAENMAASSPLSHLPPSPRSAQPLCVSCLSVCLYVCVSVCVCVCVSLRLCVCLFVYFRPKDWCYFEIIMPLTVFVRHFIICKAA